MNVLAAKRCEVVLGEKIEEVKEFKYFGTWRDRRRNKRAVKGRCGSPIQKTQFPNKSVGRGVVPVLKMVLIYIFTIML